MDVLKEDSKARVAVLASDSEMEQLLTPASQPAVEQLHEQLDRDQQLLFEPVQRFSDLWRTGDKETNIRPIVHLERPQHVQERDLRTRRRREYPHVHHPLRQMEPRALKKIRRRRRNFREEMKVLPDTKVGSMDDQKKMTLKDNVLIDFEESTIDESDSNVELESEEIEIEMPSLVSFLDEVCSDTPPISLQQLVGIGVAHRALVDGSGIEGLNNPNMVHLKATKNDEVTRTALSPSRVTFKVGTDLDYVDQSHTTDNGKMESVSKPLSRSRRLHREYFSETQLRQRLCSGADLIDVSEEQHDLLVTEPDEAATLHQADLDDMHSHRFADFRGLRHPHLRKTRSVVIQNATTPTVATMDVKCDHTPHELFVELDELVQGKDLDIDYVWRERSRWIRYEENFEEVSERWTTPHVAPLKFHAMADLRRLLEQSCCFFDMEAESLVQLIDNVCHELQRRDVLSMTEARQLHNDLLRRHDYKMSSYFLGFSKSTTLDATDAVNEIETGQGASGPRRLSETESTLMSNKTLLNRVQIAANAFLKSNTIASRVPLGAQTVSVLVGAVAYLRSPLLVFVRLAQPLKLLDTPITEVPSLPLRFLLVSMGPSNTDNDCFEVGRAFATLMTDADFHRHSFSAACREDLASGLREFLDRTTVLPPLDGSAWRDAQLLRSLARYQHRSTSRHRMPQVLSQSLLSEAESELSSLKLESVDGIKGDEFQFELSKLTRRKRVVNCASIRFSFFRDLRHDLQIQWRRFPHDVWLWTRTDNSISTALFGLLFVFFASLAPCITLGALMQKLVSKTLTVERAFIGTGVGQLLYSALGGQPLIIVGCTGPMLIMEQAAASLFQNLQMDIELAYFRFFVGLYTSVFSLIILAFNGAQVVRRITRSTEEIFNMFVGLYFLVKASTQIFGPIVHPSVPLDCLPKHCFNTSASNSSSLSLPSSSCNSNTKCYYTNDAENVTVHYCSGIYQDSAPHLRAKATATALLSLFMLFLTLRLNQIKHSSFFTRKIRKFLSAGNVPMALMVITSLNFLVFKDFCLETLAMSPKVHFSDLGLLPQFNVSFNGTQRVMFHGLALAMAICIGLINYAEIGLCCVTLAAPERRLFNRHAGYDSSLLVTGVLMPFLSGLFNWPFISGAVVFSTSHTFAMALWDERQPPGVAPRLIGVAEQRVSGFCVALLLFVSVFAAPLLRSLPMASMYGMFLFMGIMSLRDLQVTGRCIALLQRARHRSEADYLQAPTGAIFIFTMMQLIYVACLIALNVVTQVTGQPYPSLCFPLVLVISALSRAYIYPRLACISRHLDVLDKPEESLPESTANAANKMQIGLASVTSMSPEQDKNNTSNFDEDATGAGSTAAESSLLLDAPPGLFEDADKPL